jgi:hypothetical protein
MTLIIEFVEYSMGLAEGKWLKGGCVLIDPWAGTLGCPTHDTDEAAYPAGLRKHVTEHVKADFAAPEG